MPFSPRMVSFTDAIKIHFAVHVVNAAVRLQNAGIVVTKLVFLEIITF